MFRKGILADRPFFAKLLIFVGLMVLGWASSLIIGLMLVPVFFGVDLITFAAAAANPMAHMEAMNALKFIQFLQASIMFIAAPFLYLRLTSADSCAAIQWKAPEKPIFYFYAVLMLVVASPLVAVLVKINEQLTLPEALAGLEQSIKQMEASAQELTKAFMKVDGLIGLLINVLIIAVLAGISEEIVFRGVLQKMLQDKMRNAHWAILISAFVFSAIHMQFYGFLPRFVMGVLLGYLYFWSGSLWMSMIAHSINNALAVVMSYLYERQLTSINPDDNDIFPWYVLLSSLLILGAMAFSAFKNREVKVLWQD